MTLSETPIKTIAALLLPAMLAGACSEQRDATHLPAEHERAVEGSHHGHAHAGHGREHAAEEEGLVQLSEAELREFGIELRTAETGTLSLGLSLPGEVVFNPGRLAHVTPRVPGVVWRVLKGVGDEVEAGDVLAVLESRALAQAQAGYLAAQATLELARTNFERMAGLFEQEISPEAEYLRARQALRGAEVDLRLAERNLRAMGLSEQQVERIAEQEAGEALTRYELTAPISGTIIARHLTRGEVIPLQPNDPPFVVANLESVWVQLTVYPTNLGQVRAGQRVRIAAEHTGASAVGEIDYVSPRVGHETRTALARVALNNEAGLWRPGQFVTARVELSDDPADVVVSRSALQTVEGQTLVYVRSAGGFEPRPVEVGRGNQDRVEIVSGLEAGERYAAANTFTLKAEQRRGLLEHAGHAH